MTESVVIAVSAYKWDALPRALRWKGRYACCILRICQMETKASKVSVELDTARVVQRGYI
ncbi:protein of unknown function [Hyphomicrobium sp. MC1]|nr:protein of unknown function [Hyphomicrobium sp. MC1]